MTSLKVGLTTVTSNQVRFILASASPRRLELLKRLGFFPDKVLIPNIDEKYSHGEVPRDYVLRMAIGKSQVFCLKEKDILLAADTVVAKGRRIIGKPISESHAREILEALSGSRHRVLTGIAVRTFDQTTTRVVQTVVKMKKLSSKERDDYLASGEWQGKAGGYGIQGRAEQFIPWIRGSYTNVVGLPLYETRHLLLANGLRPL